MTIHIIPERKTTFGNTCVHYKGVSLRGESKDHKPFEDQCCSAGVRYGDVMVDGEWKYHRAPHTTGRPYTAGRCMPCHRDTNFADVKCNKAQFPTDEEVAEWLKEMDGRINRIGVARKAIIEHLDGKYGGGTIPCPVCKTGTLGFSRASCNGHVHAKCSTADCVAWME